MLIYTDDNIDCAYNNYNCKMYACTIWGCVVAPPLCCISHMAVLHSNKIKIQIYGATKARRVENLATHGIMDKAPYLSEAIMLRLLFFPYCLFPYTIDHR